jgi:hypothetical protein
MATKKATAKKQPFDFRSLKVQEDGFKKLGMDPAVMPDISRLPERFKWIKIVFIIAVLVEAANDGWKPNFADHNQKKYFIWPLVSSFGLDFSDSGFSYDNASAIVGFPLYVKSPEIARYLFEQFPDLYKGWLIGVYQD